ncbi:cx9C motif-containing protein 4 isoform X1 [Vigna unguiculata]|uniref:cx9C motif-containing protein 4 isoform X1 n=1 Tax=Vigna unguiculata TaxID=3917 RepID=UPI00101629CE|nr:cx9C motif-containing protein 4 isoform X1 [Vigna unguiculata]
MAQATKEPCKKEACDIQACLSKNNFLPQSGTKQCLKRDKPEMENMCLKVIELLDSCCAKCNYNSTHCASLSGLLKQKPKGYNATQPIH